MNLFSRFNRFVKATEGEHYFADAIRGRGRTVGKSDTQKHDN